MKKENSFWFTDITTPLTALITVITAIVYITAYVSSLDKRQTLNEQSIHELRIQMNDLNKTEGDEIASFHTDVYAQLARLDDKIDKIYGILVNQKHQSV